MERPESSGYERFDRLIADLKAEGYSTEAGRLHTLLHEVAWTTSSELLGELGREIIDVRRTTLDPSAALRQSLAECMEAVKRVWPAIEE